MKRFFLFALTLAVLPSVHAGWWIFGDDDELPRLSELIEPASLCIDEASDLASEGRVTDAVMKYREALKEIDKIEAAYANRLDQPEFATLKTKRAFVTAAIDSMLLSQAKENAKVVATSDTTELEKRLAKEKGLAAEQVTKPQLAVAKSRPAVTQPQPARQTVRPADSSPRSRAMTAIQARDFAAAEVAIAEMLKENPKSAVALNLRAAKESAQGKFKEAERTLDAAIESNPRDYHAYYNMSVLYLQTRKNDKSAARRYYETGRIFGGPEDPELEAALK